MAERRFIEVGRSGDEGQPELDAQQLGGLGHSVAVIGAPGIGKSHFLEHLAERDPGRFSLLSLRGFLNGSAIQPGRVLLLDGLDECAQPPDQALDGLCRRLAAAGRPQFGLTCRQSSWVGEVFLPILRGCDARIGVYRLLPLGGQAQEDLAGGYGPEGTKILAGLRRRLGEQVAGNPLLLKMACQGGELPGSLDAIYARHVSDLVAEANPAISYNQARVSQEKRLAVAGRMMLVLLAAGKRGFRPAQSAATGEDLLAIEDAVAPEQLPAARDVLATSLFAHSPPALVPVHQSVAEFMAGRFLAERAKDIELAASSICGADIAGRQPPAPGREGVFAWFAHATAGPGRRQLFGADPYGYVASVGAQDLSLSEYAALLHALAEDPKYHLPWSREFWQRLHSQQPGRAGLFQAQLQSPVRTAAAGRLRKVVLDVLANSADDFRVLLPAVAGLLAEPGEDEGVRIRALDCLVHHASHGLIARALRLLGARQEDAGGCAWLRSRYTNRVLRSEILRAGGISARKAIVNFFAGRLATDYLVFWRSFVEQMEAKPELAKFALAWLQRRNRLQLAAEQDLDGSCLLAHLAAAALAEGTDSKKLLQLLLTPAGKLLFRQPVFRERLQQLSGRKLDELLAGMLAALGTEAEAPDEGMVIDLLAIGKHDGRRFVAALEGALADSPDRRLEASRLLCLLHKERRLEREIRIRAEASGSVLAGLIASCRRGRLLEDARSCRQQARLYRRSNRRLARPPDFIEQVRENPALVEGFDVRQLSWMHMQMHDPELARLLQPARIVYLDRCRAMLDSKKWKKISEITDDYGRGTEYIGQNPFLDGMDDLFAKDRDEFGRLPDRITSIGIVFATVCSRYREALPAWLANLAADGQRLPLVRKLVPALAVKALRHKDADWVGEWLDRYAGAFGDQLHLAVLGKSGKTARPLGLASVLVGAMRVAVGSRELAEVIESKRKRPGFAGWPAAVCWHLAAWLLDGEKDNADRLLKAAQDAKALELALEVASWLDRDRLSARQKALLLELALVYFGDRSIHAGLLVGMDATAAELISDLLGDLDQDASWQTFDALERLSEKACFADFDQDAQFQIRKIMARSLPQKLARDFLAPEPAAICGFLDRGALPANATALQVFVRKEMQDLESRYRRGEGDEWSKFFNLDGREAVSRKPENLCRNYIAADMRARLAQRGVTVAAEHQLAQEKKADLWIGFEQLRLPVEVKCDDSPDLWDSGLRQIDGYTRHPACRGHGIYLVLWFGCRHVRSRAGAGRITSPEALEEQLAGCMRTINPRVSVRVMNLSEPERQSWRNPAGRSRAAVPA